MPAPTRPSIHDRERVARRLRRACGDQRLSLDTFASRLDAVYGARSEADLDALVDDIPDDHGLTRLLFATTTWLSAAAAGLEEAWCRARTRPLLLPTRERVLIGRSRDCDCVVSDPTVSRRHALLGFGDGRWLLRDLHSLNGTYVNGARLVDAVEVRSGDEACFGRARFRLTAAATAEAARTAEPGALVA